MVPFGSTFINALLGLVVLSTINKKSVSEPDALLFSSLSSNSAFFVSAILLTSLSVTESSGTSTF